jgi:hypothetical protein
LDDHGTGKVATMHLEERDAMTWMSQSGLPGSVEPDAPQADFVSRSFPWIGISFRSYLPETPLMPGVNKRPFAIICHILLENDNT